MIEINKIYNENCIDTLNKIEDNFIDLTITSPPYTSILSAERYPECENTALRNYKGYEFDFKNIAKELFRVTKNGGVVVWNINDITIDGSESGESFLQALYFKDIGFKLHDTMIWKKASPFCNPMRYLQSFEYLFILVKGKIQTYNLIQDRPNIWKGHKVHGQDRLKTGNKIQRNNVKNRRTKDFGVRTNIWEIAPASAHIENREWNHPAPFPIKLVNDMIISWSNPNDIIYDPFSGSATTIISAIENNRQWIGSEISEEYYNTSLIRINKTIKENENKEKRKSLLNIFKK
jgi:site-specific DNA-methyltransferase (adenine-specific)